MDKWDKQILQYLTEHFRKSKKDDGSNKTNRRTQLKPEKLYKQYRTNDGDLDVIHAINQTVNELRDMGFVTYAAEKFGTQIQSVYLVDEKIEQVEKYLFEKYGVVSRSMRKENVQRIIDEYQHKSEICKRECELYQEQLRVNRFPKEEELLPKILDAICFIENNTEDLYVREVSMKVYGDSKFFEEQTYNQVCNLLRKYQTRPSRPEELPDEILMDFHIKKEPLKFSIKGKFSLTLDGREIDFSGFPFGVEIDTETLSVIERIHIKAPSFMTIENRTSYLRYTNEDTVTFYLGGYANRFQRDFLQKTATDNPNITYLHFGDIDPGGFWIHHNLRQITGVDFKTFAMSTEELSNSQFVHCLHPLTDNDIVRCQELLEMACYQNTIAYMLEHQVKLEQEIISLAQSTSQYYSTYSHVADASQDETNACITARETLGSSKGP
jgi:hypothetical protein